MYHFLLNRASRKTTVPQTFAIWILSLIFLHVFSANSLAQPSAQIAGTFKMTQIYNINRSVGGANLNSQQTIDVGPVDVTQNGLVFSISKNALTTTPLIGTITNNSVTSLSGSAKSYPVAGHSVSTNSIVFVTNWLSSTQMVIFYRGQANGMSNSYTFKDVIESYIFLTGSFTPLLPPAITVHPKSLTNVIGSKAVFNVEATNATPLLYQWRKDGALIPYATNSSYVIESVAAANAGNYTVQVSNGVGTTNSLKAALALRFPPSITTQPTPLLKQQSGTTATLKVKVTGTPNFFYQWQLNGQNIDKATNSTCTVAFDPVNGKTNLTVNVVVTNAFGVTVSSNATLIILPDITRPTVAITSPAAGARTATPLFSGLASDNGRVAKVTYWVTNINNGIITNNDQGTAILVETNLSKRSWQATPTLLPGTNIVAVQSQDESGNLSPVIKRSFFYQVTAPFTLKVGGDGTGTVIGKSSVAKAGEPVPKLGTNNLYLGQSYSIQATPTPVTSFFTNWTGPTSGNLTNTLIKFTMEPGLTFQANFATNLFVRMAGTYNGLFAHTNGEVNQQSAGMLRNLSVKKDGTYSGQLLVSGVAYTLSGKFDRSARSSKIISRSVTAGGPVNVDLHLIWDNTPRQLLGTVSTPSWTAELIANLSGTQMQTGIATVLIPPAEDTLQPSPAGYGYILTTTKAGTVTFTGALADRTPISQTVAISEQGWSPIYASLYKNTGLLWGWMAMTNNSPSGTLYWIKPASTALLFPNGFTNSIETISSPWRIPTGPALPFSPTNFGILEISGGPLTAPITFSNIIVRADNTLINVSSSPTNTLSGSIAPKTGLLKITFGNGKTKTAAAGAVLQNSTNAAGAFLGTTNTGTFTLH